MDTTEREAGRYDFAAAQLDYQAGGWSVNALANKYQIPEATLRRHAKKYSWEKGSSDAKRALVKAAMAGIPLGYDEQTASGQLVDEVRQLQLSAAEQDIADMDRGLTVARRCMATLLVMAATAEHPKDVKLIVESNKLAVETIRKIRGLDDEPLAPEATLTLDIGDGFAELRAAFDKRLGGAVVGGELADEVTNDAVTKLTNLTDSVTHDEAREKVRAA